MPLNMQIKSFRPEPGKSSGFSTDMAFTSKFPIRRHLLALEVPLWGKERRRAIGVYPEVSLRDARRRRDEACKLLSTGVDPIHQRKKDKPLQLQRSGATFEKIGREWYGKQAEIWSQNHAKRVLSRLQRDLFPYLGDSPVTELEAPQIVAVLRRMEARDVRETIHRAKQDCEAIFDFAIAAGKCSCEGDKSARAEAAFGPLRGYHRSGSIRRAFSARWTAGTLRPSVRASRSSSSCTALRVEKGETEKRRFRQAEWRFVASKTRPQLIVPLSRQVLAILHRVTGSSPFVFPSAQ